MNHGDAFTWLQNLDSFGIKLGLSQMKKLLHQLDHPQESLRIIHVGGTNGKGSVCRYIASILEQAGYSVGVYTSPHLVRINERFIINQTMISNDELEQYITRIRHIIEKSDDKNFTPTYFEVCTAISFLFFQRHAVDFAIIEVGLGGRLDATNVVKPLLSIITNVSLEHQTHLGNTIESIAEEKAGIIKKNTPIVTAAVEPALSVIKKKASLQKAPLIIQNNQNVKILSSDLKSQRFQIQGVLSSYEMSTSCIGIFQGINIAVAITAIETLQKNGVFISHDAIINGITLMKYAGRMQIFYKNPLVVLDGAHNTAALSMLKETITSLPKFSKCIIVFGVMKDKDIKCMIRILDSFGDIFILTLPHNKRAADPRYVSGFFSYLDSKKKIKIILDLKDALDYAQSIAQKEDMICITGSLFTVGEAIMLLEKHHLFSNIDNSND